MVIRIAAHGPKYYCKSVKSYLSYKLKNTLSLVFTEGHEGGVRLIKVKLIFVIWKRFSDFQKLHNCKRQGYNVRNSLIKKVMIKVIMYNLITTKTNNNNK